MKLEHWCRLFLFANLVTLVLGSIMKRLDGFQLYAQPLWALSIDAGIVAIALNIVLIRRTKKRLRELEKRIQELDEAERQILG